MRVSLSIVSHGQGALIAPLLADLMNAELGEAEVLVTLNTPENEFYLSSTDITVSRVIRNLRPRGFGANHNRAFELSKGDFFVVLNPDLRVVQLTLQPLLDLFADPGVACVGPRIDDPHGQATDSPRRFPTLRRLAQRVLYARKGPDEPPPSGPAVVDWVGGMFMVFRRETFARFGGFDERFFMYMEDVDICRRARDHGLQVVYQPAVRVVHEAQRRNRRNWRHLSWHLRSLARYLLLYRVTRRWR